MNENVLIIGATSGIARCLCHRMAQRNCRLVLAARHVDEAKRIAQDLEIRYGHPVAVEAFEALCCDEHAALFHRCLDHVHNELSGVVLCHGCLPDQKKSEQDFSISKSAFEINFVSAVSVLNLAASHFEGQQRGYIVAISSVAGDRGRQSNYTYGASKAALNVYLQGLRNRLYPSGVHVLTVKPGFVDTPMTEGLLNPRSPLVASPQRVARDIDRAIQRRSNVIYTPWFWGVIMKGIRWIPEWVFKRGRL